MTRRRKILLYTAFTLFALVASFVLLFPYDTLGRRLEAEITRASPGTTVIIHEIGPALPLGVRLADVELAREGKDGAPGTKFTIDRIRIRPAWLALLSGKPGASFTIDLLDGSVDGRAVMGRDGMKLEVVLNALQLDGKQVEAFTGVQLGGGLSGRIDLERGADGQISSGAIAAVLAGGKLRGGKIMGFSVPALDLGSPELSITIDKNEAKLAKFEARSPDLELGGGGSATLRPDLMSSLVRGSLKLKLTDSFLGKNPTIKGMLGFAGPMKKPDGTIELPLSGTLARPVSLPGFPR